MQSKAVAAALWAVAALSAPAGFAQPAPSLVPPVAAPVLAAPSPAPAQTSAPLTRADAEAWLDGYLPYALNRGNIAGAVVVIVKNGQVLLQKGYGYADVEARKPVDPETTMFRPGSVSKLFTWTAVMQQVEQGKIDLDHDVNQYLDFKIPAFQDKPVTMRNLMTHTGGSEEWLKNLIGADPTPETSLRTLLTSHFAARIFPPGQVPAYSNFGATLAAYIVHASPGSRSTIMSSSISSWRYTCGMPAFASRCRPTWQR